MVVGRAVRQATDSARAITLSQHTDYSAAAPSRKVRNWLPAAVSGICSIKTFLSISSNASRVIGIMKLV